MNLFESEILNKLYFEPFVNQRILAETTGCSVGAVNKALRQLTEAGYLDGQTQLTDKGRQEVRGKMPKSAIILAAGFGMRMVPINTSTPKALLEVNGEPLIERTIRQLHEAGVTNITVVVGFMKEQFEYLIDEFGVDLAVNSRGTTSTPSPMSRAGSTTPTSSPATSGARSTLIPAQNPIPGIWSAIRWTRTALSGSTESASS